MKPTRRARFFASLLGVAVLIAMVVALARPSAVRQDDAWVPESPDAPEPAPSLRPLQPIPRVHAGALRAVLAAPPVLEAPEVLDGPLQLLPPDTVAVLAVPSWSTLVEKVGLRDLLAAHQWRLSEMDEKLGQAGLSLYDLLDPSSLGIDPTGSLVLAWLDTRATVMVIGARLQDPAAFESTLAVLLGAGPRGDEGDGVDGVDGVEGSDSAGGPGGRGFRTEEMGEALVTIQEGDSPEFAFVRRGGMVYLLGREGWNADLETAAAQLAWQDPEQGLPTTDAWLRSMAQVRGRDGFAFVNLPAITGQARLSLEESQTRSEDWPDGEEPEWAVQVREREQAVSNLAEGVLGSFGGLAAGFELAGGRVEMDARVDLGAETLLGSFLRNRGTHSHLQRALEQQPVFLMDGAVDPAALRQLVGLFFGIAGQDFEQAMTIAGPAMGFDGDPFAQLSGELGVAVMAPNDEDPAWGVTVVLGIVDTEAADEAVRRLGVLGQMTGMVTYDEGMEALRVEVPAWRSLTVGRADKALVATSDLRVLERLRGGYSTSPSSWGARPEVSALAGSLGDAGVILWDFKGIKPSLEEGNHVYTPTVSEGQTESQRALDDIARRMREEQEQTREVIATNQSQLLDLLGTLVATARAEGPSLSIRGAWVYGAANARELGTRLAGHAAAISDAEELREKAMAPLYEEQRVLLDKHYRETGPY